MIVFRERWSDNVWDPDAVIHVFFLSSSLGDGMWLCLVCNVCITGGERRIRRAMTIKTAMMAGYGGDEYVRW